MLQLKPLDQKVPIFQQINSDASPVVLVNIFQVAEEDIPRSSKSLGGGRQLDEAAAWLHLYAVASGHWWKHRFHELCPVGVCSALSGSVYASRVQAGARALPVHGCGFASSFHATFGIEPVRWSIAQRPNPTVKRTYTGGAALRSHRARSAPVHAAYLRHNVLTCRTSSDAD